MWQDVAAAILGLALGIFIWPMIYKIWVTKDVMGHTLLTALPTASFLAALAVVYTSAGLVLTGAVHVVSSSAWFIAALLIYRYRGRRVCQVMELDDGITMEEL